METGREFDFSIGLGTPNSPSTKSQKKKFWEYGKIQQEEVRLKTFANYSLKKVDPKKLLLLAKHGFFCAGTNTSKKNKVIGFSCGKDLDDPCDQDPADPALHESDCELFVNVSKNVPVPYPAQRNFGSSSSTNYIVAIPNLNDSGFGECVISSAATDTSNASNASASSTTSTNYQFQKLMRPLPLSASNSNDGIVIQANIDGKKQGFETNQIVQSPSIQHLNVCSSSHLTSSNSSANDAEYQECESAFETYCKVLKQKGGLPLKQSTEKVTLKKQADLFETPTASIEPIRRDLESPDDAESSIDEEGDDATFPSFSSPNTGSNLTSTPDCDDDRWFVSPQHSSASDDSDEEYSARHLLNPQQGVRYSSILTDSQIRDYQHKMDLSKESHRRATFDGWPLTIGKFTPNALSKCGFFYLKTGEHAQCHYCGEEVITWDEDDDIAEIHRSWCKFAKKTKDQNTHPLDMQRSAISVPESDEEFLCSSFLNSAQSNPGCELVWKYGDAGFVTRVVSEPLNSQKLSSNELQTNGATLKNTFGEIPGPFRTKSPGASMTTPQRFDHDSFANTSSSEPKSTATSSTATSSTATSSTATSCTATNIQDQASENSKPNYICKKCCNRGATVLVLPCKHLSLCISCSKQEAICPQCKCNVIDTIRINQA